MNVNHKENPTLVCCIPQTARLVLYYLVRFFTVNQTQTLMNEPKIWHEGVRWEVRWTLWVNSLHLLLGGRHIWAPNLKAAVKTFPSRPRMSTSFGWIVCPLWKSEPNLTEIHFYSKITDDCLIIYIHDSWDNAEKGFTCLNHLHVPPSPSPPTNINTHEEEPIREQ